MKTDKFIRIRLTTFRRIKQNFPAEKNETLVDYFERLSKYMSIIKIQEKIDKQDIKYETAETLKLEEEPE